MVMTLAQVDKSAAHESAIEQWWLYGVDLMKHVLNDSWKQFQWASGVLYFVL